VSGVRSPARHLIHDIVGELVLLEQEVGDDLAGAGCRYRLG
jgi:hypothetical protein